LLPEGGMRPLAVSLGVLALGIDDVVGWDFDGQDNLNEVCTSCGSPEQGTRGLISRGRE